MSEPSHVELDRLSAVQSESNAIGHFMGWLEETRGYSLCERHTHTDECREPTVGRSFTYICGFCEDEMVPVFGVSIVQLLADHFEIDLEKVEDERTALVEHLQKIAAE